MELYIDLEKAMWKEEQHKRLPNGRFTTIKTGSKIVTSSGKTGIVTKVADKHYHYRDEATGNVTKVVKANAIHHSDHKKLVEAEKKKKTRKVAATKGKTTKATNKANGTGKAKTIEEPKTKKKVATVTSKTKGKNVAESKKTVGKKGTPKKEVPVVKKPADKKPALVVSNDKVKRPSKAEKEKQIAETNRTKRRQELVGDDVSLNSPDKLKTKEVKMKNVGKEAPAAVDDKQNKAIEDYSNIENDAEATKTIDSMWNDPAIQKLMKRKPEKRSEADIRRLAGDITTQNDNLARYVTLQMGKARGLNLLNQVNKIGDIGQSGNGEVISQETGHYGDLLQAARGSMYETLYKVMKGSQNSKEGTKIGAHVVSRMKQKLHSDIYNIMNEVPAPHEIRTAIGDMSKAKNVLTQKLGREPEDKELAEHLQSNSSSFKNAPIMDHPTYDEKSGQWIATKKRITDPVERLKTLQTYASQQKASSIDENMSSEGEKEVTRADNLRDDQLTPDEAYEKKERQKELKTAIPKALSSMGLTKNEKLVFMIMYGSPSAKVKRGNMTMPEVAEAINTMGGLDGKKISEKEVYNVIRSAMKKLKAAKDNDHPALKELSMFKSLFYNLIMKAMYEYDLVKSLNSFGIGLDALDTVATRVATGDDLTSIKKSLAPYEYIGSVVTTEDGGIHARIVELTLPEDNVLYKSFTEALETLRKSMFPHKGKSNHAVNQKAGEYVKNNKAKYTSVSEAQHAAARKGGGHTWSEELLLKHPGSAWLTWGGKRILVNVADGKILYDSANEAHREEHNQGAQEDKIDFHHEKAELAAKGLEDTEDNRHTIDQGIQAFKEQMEDMRKEWKEKIQPDLKNKTKHKVTRGYNLLNDEQRKTMDEADDDEKASILGKAIVDHKRDEIEAILQKYNEQAKGLQKGDKAGVKQLKADFAKEMQALEKKDFSHAIANGDKMKTLAGRLIDLKGNLTPETQKDLEKYIGEAEISRGNEEASKKLLPEGTFMVGNPVTGKTMVVKIKHGFGEGVKNNWTSSIAEAFDPEGGEHEDLNSWGGLGRALGIKGATNIQEMLAQKANTTEDKPFMKQISDEEFNKMRSNTKTGLRETMTHKNFKLVGENRDRKGNLISRTYAQDMPDGSQNTVHINKDGYITDPVMARLLKQRKPINNVNDLHDAMQKAVGNRAWVTAHFGSDINIGDALGHHIQLEYDGKGAPRVVGGTYDGYRFMDTKDIPKGAIDPATGEPIKALFKNGRLVDRKFTTKNKVPLKEGNQVLYKSEKGTYRKGRIYSIEGDNYKLTDGHGHVIGMFKKDDLKQATTEGKATSESGQAVVRIAQNGVHRMNTEDVFKALNAKDQKKVDKVKELFEQALRKAGINKTFDSEGNLNKDLELSDPMMKKLKSILGRSKAGRELLSNFNSAYTKELELHVPDSLKAQIEAEGVIVGANGTAKISAGKFEQLREVLGGLSIDNNARKYLEDHFNRKDRVPLSERRDEIEKEYQPKDTEGEFGKVYRSQFKAGGNVMSADRGLYNTQLDGVAHMTERGRCIVGAGMGTGKYTLDKIIV